MSEKPQRSHTVDSDKQLWIKEAEDKYNLPIRGHRQDNGQLFIELPQTTA